MLMVNSPLEQFRILPILSMHISNIDISFTNSALTACLFLFLLLSLLETIFSSSVLNTGFSCQLYPSRWQYVFEVMFGVVSTMLADNVGLKGQKAFPFVFSIFLYVLTMNIGGLVPYSFTVTSHLMAVLCLASIIFLGVNFIGSVKHGWRMFSLFYPGGTSLVLGLLLVPIECISYVFKPISLAIRLFANMMAGHTLLKVIAGFSWTLSKSTGLLFVGHLIPMVVLVPLFGLELGVALIQAYVFTLLTCIYISDALNLH